MGRLFATLAISTALNAFLPAGGRFRASNPGRAGGDAQFYADRRRRLAGLGTLVSAGLCARLRTLPLLAPGLEALAHDLYTVQCELRNGMGAA